MADSDRYCMPFNATRKQMKQCTDYNEKILTKFCEDLGYQVYPFNSDCDFGYVLTNETRCAPMSECGGFWQQFKDGAKITAT